MSCYDDDLEVQVQLKTWPTCDNPRERQGTSCQCGCTTDDGAPSDAQLLAPVEQGGVAGGADHGGRRAASCAERAAAAKLGVSIGELLSPWTGYTGGPVAPTAYLAEGVGLWCGYERMWRAPGEYQR